MSKILPVEIRGDSNAQLRGVAATIRSMPERVQPQLMLLIASQIPSTRSFEEIVFVSAVPKIRKWVSERAGGVIGTLKQTIGIDTYEVSMAINADDYDDDQIGAYAPVLEELMQSLLLAPDELLVTNLIINADTSAVKSVDGVNFYATTHKWPGGKYTTNQSNLCTRTGVDAAAIETDFFTATNAMMGWKDDQGRLRMPPVDFQSDDALIVHHPLALRKSMQSVFGVTKGGDAFDLQPTADQTKMPRRSQLSGKAILIPDGYLDADSTSDWYIHSVKGVGNAKPFAFLDREAPRVTIFARGSEHYEKNNEVLFLGKRRFGMGVLRCERSQKVAA